MSNARILSEKVYALTHEADVSRRVIGAENVIFDLRKKPEYISNELDERDRNDLDTCMEILRQDGDKVTHPFLENLRAKPQGRALEFTPDPSIKPDPRGPTHVVLPKLV